jgi:hypothetical protein
MENLVQKFRGCTWHFFTLQRPHQKSFTRFGDGRTARVLDESVSLTKCYGQVKESNVCWAYAWQTFLESLHFLQHQEAKWSGNFKYPRRHTFIHVFVSTLKIRDKKDLNNPGKKGTGSRVRTQAAGFTTCRYYHCAIGGYSTVVHPITICHLELHLVNTKRHQAVRRILFSPSLLPSHSAASSHGWPRPPLSTATTSAAGDAASPSAATSPPANRGGRSGYPISSGQVIQVLRNLGNENHYPISAPEKHYPQIRVPAKSGSGSGYPIYPKSIIKVYS